MVKERMLLEYNIPVYQNLCETLEKYRKAIVVAFTGCGKSFIANEFLTERKLSALVVCPKRAICDQWRGLNPNVTAVTYNYFARAPMEELLAYEVVVLDEAHHCGSPVWGKRTKEFMADTKGYVIGLTADPTRWSDGGRNVAEEIFEGHLVKGTDLKGAIDNGIILEPRYVCTIIGLKEEVKKCKAKYERLKKENMLTEKTCRCIDHTLHQLKLDAESVPSVQKTLKKYMPRNPKGIVFVDDIAAIDEARGLMADAFPGLPIYAVHSKQPEDVNREQMVAFTAAKTACIISVNMFGEGVHVKNMNFVAMLRRTQSPTVFFQQLGRVTVANSKNRPVVFDIVGNGCTLKSIEVRKSDVLGLFQRDGAKKGGQVIIESRCIKIRAALDKIYEQLAQYKPWTKPEDAILYEHYPDEGQEVYKRFDGRTRNACCTRAHILGIRRKVLEKWTPERNAYLKKEYPKRGAKIIHDPIFNGTNITSTAAVARAKELGVRCERQIKWTPKLENYLKKEYPKRGTEIANDPIFERTGVTKWAIINKAIRLGVRYEVSKWTSELESYLKAEYPQRGASIAHDDVFRKANISKNSIRKKASKLGVRYTGRP